MVHEVGHFNRLFPFTSSVLQDRFYRLAVHNQGALLPSSIILRGMSAMSASWPVSWSVSVVVVNKLFNVAIVRCVEQALMSHLRHIHLGRDLVRDIVIVDLGGGNTHWVVIQNIRSRLVVIWDTLASDWLLFFHPFDRQATLVAPLIWAILQVLINSFCLGDVRSIGEQGLIQRNGSGCSGYLCEFRL